MSRDGFLISLNYSRWTGIGKVM